MAGKKPKARANRERHKRPELPRSEPIRSWSTLFGSGNGSSTRTNLGAGATDSVRRGVELGYRVIDDYIKQGAALADAFSGPVRAQPALQELPQMTERMLQYASDFSALWFDAMGTMMSNANQRSPGAQPTPDSASAASEPRRTARSPFNQPAPAKANRSRLAVEIQSARPVDVLVTWDEPFSDGLAKVEPLRARSGKQTISDVSVAFADGPEPTIKVKLRVPPDLRVGRYTGAILDADTKNPRGRLTVTIAE